MLVCLSFCLPVPLSIHPFNLLFMLIFNKDSELFAETQYYFPLCGAKHRTCGVGVKPLAPTAPAKGHLTYSVTHGTLSEGLVSTA